MRADGLVVAAADGGRGSSNNLPDGVRALDPIAIEQNGAHEGSEVPDKECAVAVHIDRECWGRRRGGRGALAGHGGEKEIKLGRGWSPVRSGKERSSSSRSAAARR